jgi:hypothetical protein
MLLDPQNILAIGMPPGAVYVRTSKFFDTFNVNDFRLLAWNSETLVAEIEKTTGQSFQSHHHLFVYRRFKELYEEKIIPIFDWIKYGHVLVIFPYHFDKQMKTDGVSGIINIDINQLPPFGLVRLSPIPVDSVEAFGDFRSQFDEFSELFKCGLALSGEGIVPLFRTRHESSTIAGAAFWVGKGAVVFSPLPKNWTDPKLLDYFETLAKLPEILRQPVDLPPERTSRLRRPALWLAALPALIIAAITLSFFFTPPMERLPSSGGERSAARQDYATLDARLTEIEKRTASSSFDVAAIKSAENELAHRVDRLEAALPRLREPPVSTPLESSAPPTPPAAAPHLSNERPPAWMPPAASLHLSSEEIAELLARGDTLVRSGDIASARLFYERAANAGNGRAALLLGATFDPVFLDRGTVLGVPSDPAEARLWYQRARDLGEAEAERRLKSFEAK